jgi:hypothetical protein
MIQKEYAVKVRDLALKAIQELSTSLKVDIGQCSEADYERLKAGVGVSIGHIQTDILDFISQRYPELDDL